MGNSKSLEHVNWSASASRLFDACPRRFYYRYQRDQVSNSNGEYTPPVGAYLGTVIHECLAAQVSQWAQGKNVHLQTATDHATAELEEYVETHAETIATQFYDNDEDSFDSDGFARSLIRTAHKHIRRFFRVIWPRFDGHRYIAHEIRQSFEICGEPVTVQPDLCTRSTEGEFIVTDWKTSAYDRFGDPTIQMQAYALYAHKAYEPELERIQVQLAHTRTGEFDRMVPTEEDIERVRERIKADRTIWTREGNIEAYETDPEAQKCGQCPYLKRCTVGQDIVSRESGSN